MPNFTSLIARSETSVRTCCCLGPGNGSLFLPMRAFCEHAKIQRSADSDDEICRRIRAADHFGRLAVAALFEMVGFDRAGSATSGGIAIQNQLHQIQEEAAFLHECRVAAPRKAWLMAYCELRLGSRCPSRSGLPLRMGFKANGYDGASLCNGAGERLLKRIHRYGRRRETGFSC